MFYKQLLCLHLHIYSLWLKLRVKLFLHIKYMYLLICGQHFIFEDIIYIYNLTDCGTISFFNIKFFLYHITYKVHLVNTYLQISLSTSNLLRQAILAYSISQTGIGWGLGLHISCIMLEMGQCLMKNPSFLVTLVITWFCRGWLQPRTLEAIHCEAKNNSLLSNTIHGLSWWY